MKNDVRKLLAAILACTILTAPVYCALAFVFLNFNPLLWPITGRAILGAVWLIWFLIGHYSIAND